ncbi:casB, partial [Symbiodinium pilosum]
RLQLCKTRRDRTVTGYLRRRISLCSSLPTTRHRPKDPSSARSSTLVLWLVLSAA